MSSDVVIHMEGVEKSFSGHPVLKGINLKVHHGRTRVILGLSGSGKTVLMKHMIGLFRPDRGIIVVDGLDITTLDAQGLLQLRRKFGMVFQQAALFDSMTVKENVAFPLREHTQSSEEEIHHEVMQKLKLVGLEAALDKFPAELSGGMRKRVGLARAVILGPKVVLYDEPTTGLDPITTENVDHMILDAKQQLNVTGVVISHDVGSALRIGDDIAVLHEGEILADCNKDELIAPPHPFVQRFLHTWLNR